VLVAVPVSAAAVPSHIAAVVLPAARPEISCRTSDRPPPDAHVAVIVGFVPTIVVPPLPDESTA
jgi:hypothetical protein